MTDNQAVINVFSIHQEAEDAVIALQKAGFDMYKVSVIGQDHQTLEQPSGFFSWKDTATTGVAANRHWGSFMDGLFGILTGVGLLSIPGIGQIIIGGPVVGLLADWLEGLLLAGVGGAALGGLTGALVSLGIPEEQALLYETEIKVGMFLLMVTGSPQDEANAKRIIQPAITQPLVTV